MDENQTRETWQKKVEGTALDIILTVLCLILLGLDIAKDWVNKALEDPRQRDPKIRVVR